MGLFNKGDKGIFNGSFDFNGDGKTNNLEKFISYKIFEEFTNEDNNTSYDSDISKKHAWRDTCDDGSDEDIDPEDYDTEDEYNEALENASAESNVINIPLYLTFDGLTFENPTAKQAEEISETDYPNKRRYNAACKLAVESATCSDDECYRFITENADTLIAANYLTPTGDFLYSQAIKDNFKVPVTLPDEDETREFDFRKILQKIARKDIPLCLEVWAWCLEQFLPYVGYDISSKNDLTHDIIYYINEFSDEFPPALIQYMGEHPDFRTKVIAEAEPAISELAELITDAIKQNSLDTAKALFIDELTATNGKWQDVNRLTDNIIYNSKTYSELETIEYAEQELLPLLKTYQDGMILDEIEVWEESITEYKLQVEQTCDQYAYTRSNSWRKTVPDGKEYRLDPVDYKSEEKYLNAFNREKYRWRQTFNSKETYGLNPEDYETKDAFLEDLSPKICDKQTHGLANIPPISDDKTIYTYCGVALSFSVRPYFFRTNDTTIKIGDTVTVPIGKTQQEFEGTVVSIGQYTLRAAPYPVEMTKFISKKIEKE